MTVYEKITRDTYNIRIQHGATCYVFNPRGEFIHDEDIFEQGTLLEVGVISIIKHPKGVEVASDVNSNFKIQLQSDLGSFEELDTRMRSVAGLKYRLTRQIDKNCVQYIYVYQYGIISM